MSKSSNTNYPNGFLENFYLIFEVSSFNGVGTIEKNPIKTTFF